MPRQLTVIPVVVIPLLSLLLLAKPQEAAARGCIKGAAVGAVAGHVAGRHAIVGAVAGCAVGHHLAKKQQQERQEQQRQQLSTPARKPSVDSGAIRS